MFKKIEIWVVYLIVVILFVFSLCFGFLVRQELVGTTKFGFASRSALFLAEIPVTLSIIKKRFQTDGKGDMQVPDRFPGRSGFIGNPLEAPSYLLLSRYDGNVGKSIVELIDLTNFDVKFKWDLPINEINEQLDKNSPEYENQEIYNSERRFRASHSLMADDGGLYIHAPFAKITHCGAIEYIEQEDFYHHSLNFDADGNIWVPSHKHPSVLKEQMVGTGHQVFFDDAINKISPDGEVLYSKSIPQLLIENNQKGMIFLSGNTEFGNDPIHLNDIQPVLETTSYWEKGDVFLSMRSLSKVILYRPSENKIIWQSDGHISGQHDVDILDDSRISIFNNNMVRGVNDFYVDGMNQVVVYDFATNEYQTYLEQSLIEQEVRTISEGLSEISDTGDLFLEETNYGRSLYLNSDGTLQWAYYNRANDEKMYRTNWSRLLHTPGDIEKINQLLNTILIDGTC